jgi:hypothetical protein
MKSAIFWDITPCSPLEVNRRFGRNYHLDLQCRINRARYQSDSRWQAEWLPPAFTLETGSAYSTLKIEATYCSETSVDFQRTARCYILEDSTLQKTYSFRESYSFCPVASHFTCPCYPGTWALSLFLSLSRYIYIYICVCVCVCVCIVTWRLKAGIVKPEPDIRCWATDRKSRSRYNV